MATSSRSVPAGARAGWPAMRDAAVLKTMYAFGLRRREAWGLDLADLRHNPKVPAFGRYGGVFVRWGKSSRGSAPQRRTVLTVPEMEWIVAVLEQWRNDVRPRVRRRRPSGAVGHRTCQPDLDAPHR